MWPQLLYLARHLPSTLQFLRRHLLDHSAILAAERALVNEGDRGAADGGGDVTDKRPAADSATTGDGVDSGEGAASVDSPFPHQVLEACVAKGRTPTIAPPSFPHPNALPGCGSVAWRVRGELLLLRPGCPLRTRTTSPSHLRPSTTTLHLLLSAQHLLAPSHPSDMPPTSSRLPTHLICRPNISHHLRYCMALRPSSRRARCVWLSEWPLAVHGSWSCSGCAAGKMLGY